MKKQILSLLLLSMNFLTHALPPVKDVVLTAIPSTGTVAGAGIGYWMCVQDPSFPLFARILGTASFSLFGALITAPLTIPFTSYFTFWRAQRKVNRLLKHELFLRYDLYQIEQMNLDQLFDILHTRCHAYPLVSSFDLLSEWLKPVQESIRLFNQVKDANTEKIFECNQRIELLNQIKNVLLSLRDRIKDSNPREFDRQKLFFLEEKRIQEMRNLRQEVHMQTISASANTHCVCHK